jgi:endo-1,4-beta-xylanase
LSSIMLGNKKKAVALLAALALFFSLLPAGGAARAETVTVYHETFAGGTGAAVQSGGASLTQVSGKVFEGNDDGKALYVSNRTNNWDAADFKFSDIGLENGKTYTITVKGYVDSDAAVPSGAQAYLQPLKGNTYGWIAGADFTTGAAFTLTGTYTVDTSLHERLRVQSNEEGKTVPFYIGDILITGERSTNVREVYHETFAGGTGAAVQSGGASLTQVSGKVFEGNDDGKALYVSNRTNNWDAADFKFSDIGLENGKTYTITVKGYVDSDAAVPSGAQAYLQTVSSYALLASVNYTTGAAFTLTKTYTVDTATDDRIRVQSNEEGKTVPFYIGDILITEQTEDGPVRPPAEPFTAITFEDQKTGGFGGRAGTETLTVTNEANHTAGGAYALKVEGRTSAWHGPALRVEKYIDQGKEYKITVWVKLIEPASSQLQLSTQVADGSSANYVNLQGKTISTGDGWVEYVGTYRYNNVSSEYVTIYVESSNNATASFYIDDISFESTGSGPIEIEDLTPIKEAYKDYFLIGNAVSAEDLEGVRLKLLKLHHNVATAGNAMKPDALQRIKGTFTFDAADEMIDKVQEEGLKMHGHTLVWHQQSPAWMNTTKDESGNDVPLGREEALENLTTHIKTVVGHFGDKVISWDVVNEAMSDNPPNPSDWKASLRQSPWYNAVGSDYVEQAFLAAREVLDENPDWDIRLYYNDYNLDNQNKSRAVYNMVNEINTNYQRTHPGKLLIDGIGMQGHYSLGTNPANVQLSLERFISLGVEVSITEFDIQAGSNYQLPENLAVAQGYLYAQLFKIFKEHAANIERVTFWGMDDGTSWRSATNPTLFDKNLQAKPAYYGVIDPDKFMADNEPKTPEDAKQSTAKYATPVVDGTVDAAWSGTPEIPINQYLMAWQGATGTARALWDDSSLYVLIQVNDAELDKTSLNAYEQDSVEVFVDENNGKTAFYQDDDGQYRVNFDNETSFNPAGAATGFVSAARVSGTNYTVEMKIPFKTITPENNKRLGFDVQVNDAKSGARQSAATWNDTSGNAYQDTSVYGVLTLTGKPSGGGSQTPGGQSDGSSTPSADLTVDRQTGQIEISAKVPVVVSADGRATAIITDSVVNAVLQQITALEKTDAPPVIKLKLDSAAPSGAVTVKLPDNALSRILSANKNVSLEIVSSLCSLQLDGMAIETISKAGAGAPEITVSKVDASELAKTSPAAAEKIAGRPAYEFKVAKGGTAVSDFSGGKATASIPYTPAADEDPNAVLVYWIDGGNNLNPVISTCKDGAVEFETTHFSRFAIGYNKVSFNDVKPADDYYAAATYLGAREIITGAGYEPKRTATRGEAIVMLLKAYDIKPLANATDNFSDASGENAGYYAKAKAIGLSHGIGSNMLGADISLTREMLFTLIYNMLGITGELPAAGAPVKGPSSFSDYGELSGWSVGAVTKLVETGTLKGADNNALLPKSTVSRGEIAKVFYRLLSRQTIS